MSADGPAGQGWRVIDLQPGFRVDATRPMPELPPGIEAQVTALWDEALRQRPHLFNGTVFSADRVSPGCVEGHWTEYRRALAQIRCHDLFTALQIRPLAVNGLLQCADGLVLGRREPGSVYQPGIWQSPPAGSVERRAGASPADATGGVDLAEQVLAECQEELGLGPDLVSVSRPMVAVEHPGSHVLDVGLLLKTALRFTHVQAAWSAAANREYDLLRLLPVPEDGCEAATGLLLAPCTRAMLERMQNSSRVK